jgi:hypothetical protein
LKENGVLKEDFCFEWTSMCAIFAISMKNGAIRVVTDFRKLKLSPISFSIDLIQGHDPFNGRFFLCHRIGLEYD